MLPSVFQSALNYTWKWHLTLTLFLKAPFEWKQTSTKGGGIAFCSCLLSRLDKTITSSWWTCFTCIASCLLLSFLEMPHKGCSAEAWYGDADACTPTQSSTHTGPSFLFSCVLWPCWHQCWVPAAVAEIWLRGMASGDSVHLHPLEMLGDWRKSAMGISVPSPWSCILLKEHGLERRGVYNEHLCVPYPFSLACLSLGCEVCSSCIYWTLCMYLRTWHFHAHRSIKSNVTAKLISYW